MRCECFWKLCPKKKGRGEWENEEPWDGEEGCRGGVWGVGVGSLDCSHHML